MLIPGSSELDGCIPHQAEKRCINAANHIFIIWTVLQVLETPMHFISSFKTKNFSAISFRYKSIQICEQGLEKC